jgi:hypothetical protein
MAKWSERPKNDRWGFFGALIGMLIAAPLAIVFAYDSDSIVRYAIMAAGFLLGMGAGRLAASRT